MPSKAPNITDKNFFHPDADIESVGLIRNFQSMGCQEKKNLFRSMWQEYHVRPGLCVSVFDASLPEDFSFCYRKDNKFIDFGFFLEGDFVNNMRETPIGGLKVANRAGMWGMGFFRHIAGVVRIPARRKVRAVHLHVLPGVLATMLSEDAGCVPLCLRKALEQKGNADFSSQCCMSPKVQAVANELFFGVRNNFAVKLYMEGKVLELLGLSLVEGNCPVKRNTHSLCPRERDTIQIGRASCRERVLRLV